MDREEKVAFWLITEMLSNKVSPASVSLLNEEDRRKVIYFVNLAANYISEGRLIPREILEFIKSKVILADLRKYITEISRNGNSIRNSKTFEKDLAIIKLLLDEIRSEESVEEETQEKGLLTRSDLKYLEKLIFGNIKYRELPFECKVCDK